MGRGRTWTRPGAAAAVIQDAQEALQQATTVQAEHQAKASAQLGELRALIAKKQEESKEDMPPAAPAAQPSQESADQALLHIDFQNWLQKMDCPPHLQTYLQHMELKPKQPMNAAAPSLRAAPTTPANADLGGVNITA